MIPAVSNALLAELANAEDAYAGKKKKRKAKKAAKELKWPKVKKVTSDTSKKERDLLDAQNAALRDDRAASNAVYNFLSDLIRAERAASSFPFLSSNSERDALIERMESFFARNP